MDVVYQAVFADGDWRGIADFLGLRSGLPARVASDPQSCVAIGTGMALDNMQVIRRGQHYIT